MKKLLLYTEEKAVEELGIRAGAEPFLGEPTNWSSVLWFLGAVFVGICLTYYLFQADDDSVLFTSADYSSAVPAVSGWHDSPDLRLFGGLWAAEQRVMRR